MSKINDLKKEYQRKNKDLKHMYINHTNKFVEYIDSIDLGDKLTAIKEIHLRNSIGHYNKLGNICTISTMDNHLNAIKDFFNFLQKNEILHSIFNGIPDYDKFRNELITTYNLTPTNRRECLPPDIIKSSLEYLGQNKNHSQSYLILNLYMRINLLLPIKKKQMLNLTFNDLAKDFTSITFKTSDIKLPHSLTLDLKNAIKSKDSFYNESDKLFTYLSDVQSIESNLNATFCSVLKAIDYDIPKSKRTFSVETISNSAILELFNNNTNLYIISLLTGLSLSTLDKKIHNLSSQDFTPKNSDKIINSEISKSPYYHLI